MFIEICQVIGVISSTIAVWVLFFLAVAFLLEIPRQLRRIADALEKDGDDE